jgi:hypothetical protein
MPMKNIKFFFLINLFFLVPHFLLAQTMTTLQLGNDNDSSYYHLTKITENEYWACGEKGIITSFDSVGHFQSMDIQTDGFNILKAERIADYVLIATDDSRIMKYDLLSKTLKKVDFKKYKNRCFYDFLVLPTGKILLCGGATGISKGEKEIPFGFIAVTDSNLSDPKKIWKSFRKFAWSLLQKKDGSITAAVFNGVNTSLINTKNLVHWKKQKKINGLVHEIKLKDNQDEMSYVGTASLHYNRKGILGLDDKNNMIIDSSGCFWSQEISHNFQIICSQKGQLYIFKNGQYSKMFQLPTTFALYDMKIISNQKLLVVGHGKCAFLIDNCLN